jgi:hypothetical protein
MTPLYKYYTESQSGHGKNRPGAPRCEAILTDWFETPATLQDLALKYNSKTVQSISRVIFRAIKRKPELAGLKKAQPKRLLCASNFEGGITRGLFSLKQEVRDKINDLRAQGFTYKEIAKELNISVATAFNYAKSIDYRADRADPAEPFGLPHA